MQGVFIIFSYLIALYAGAVFVRFLAQWAQANYHNQISLALVRITQPVLAPIRKIIPSSKRYDFASLIVVALLVALDLMLHVWSGSITSQAPLFFYWLLFFCNRLLDTLFFIIIIHAIGSWFVQDSNHPLQSFLGSILEPLLAPLRRFIKPLGGVFDFTPMLLLLFIYFLQLQLPGIINIFIRLIYG